MADKSTVKVSYLGDATSLARASKRAEGAVDGVGKKAGRMNAKVAAGMAIAGAAALKFGSDSVKAFAESEKAQASLSLAYQKFPDLADVSIDSLREFNSELAKKVAFDDDALASGQAVLAQFNLTGQQVQMVTPLLADYATKTGKDLPTAATDLGRAFMGNTKALKALGINYKSTGDRALDIANIQELLRQKVGGSAEAMGETAAGKAEILKNQYGELQEQVGAKLLPALTKLADIGLKVVDWAGRNSDVLIPLAAAAGGLALAVWAVNAAAKAYAATQAALNVVMSMNPIGLVVIAVAALVAGIVIAYQKSETFRRIVDGAFKAIGTAARFMWDNVLKPVFKLWLNTWFTVIGALVNGAASAFGWVPGIGGKLKAAAKKFNEFRDDVNRALDGVKDRTVTVRAQLTTSGDFAHAKRDPDFAGKRARGGSVARGKTYLVGENGPEPFTPGVGGTITPTSGARSSGGDDRPVLVQLVLDGKVIQESLLRRKRTTGAALGLA